MKTKERFLTRAPVLAVTFLLSVLGASNFHALREVWVFYDTGMSLRGGAILLFSVMLMNIAVQLLLMALRFSGVEKNGVPLAQKKAFFVLTVISFVLVVLTVAGAVVSDCISDTQSLLVMLLYLKKDLPVILLFLLIVFLAVVFPKCKGRPKAVLSVCVALCVGGSALWTVFPFCLYRITSDPVVLDTGTAYAVVFATNANGTGFVEYTYEGAAHTVYAQNNGRRIGDRRIHSVRVPYTHLDNNSYSVGSTRVIEEFSYGSRQGKTVTKGPYSFHPVTRDKQTYLLVSDWHSYLQDAHAAISYLGDYDGVILLGDAAAGMDFEEEAVTNIVAFGGALTGGEMPALFVRGNHETRGSYAHTLPDALGYERMYYTAERGPFSFVVLDSGEDKADDHIEYGGMNDYAVNRGEMLDWLQTVKVNNTRVLALSHAWQVSEPEPEISKAAWDQFDRLGVRFVLSGHEHVCRFLDESTSDEERAFLQAHPQILAYIDGGHKNDTYIASKLTLTRSNVRFEAVDNAGNRIVDRTVAWK